MNNAAETLVPEPLVPEQLTPEPLTPEPAAARHFKRWLALGLVAAGALYFARNLILGTPVVGYAVISAPLQQTVVASGRVTLAEPIPIASSFKQDGAR